MGMPRSIDCGGSIKNNQRYRTYPLRPRLQGCSGRQLYGYDSK